MATRWKKKTGDHAQLLWQQNVYVYLDFFWRFFFFLLSSFCSVLLSSVCIFNYKPKLVRRMRAPCIAFIYYKMYNKCIWQMWQKWCMFHLNKMAMKWEKKKTPAIIAWTERKWRRKIWNKTRNYISGKTFQKWQPIFHICFSSFNFTLGCWFSWNFISLQRFICSLEWNFLRSLMSYSPSLSVDGRPTLFLAFVHHLTIQTLTHFVYLVSLRFCCCCCLYRMP